MTPHIACPMHDASQIGDARRQAARLAAELAFDELAAGRVALIVTELATNLVRHARGGTLLIGRQQGEHGISIELVSIDRGPGMHDPEHSLTDGVSTFGSAGNGLGAVRRVSTQFWIFSKPPEGSVVVARVSAQGAAPASAKVDAKSFSFGALGLAAPHEVQSGDSWAYHHEGGRAQLLVADGLGHGPQAAEAADAAVRVFESQPSASPKDILEAAHLALRSTRGAAVASLMLDSQLRSIRFCGAGNIAARLISGVQDRTLLSQHGTVGLQIRHLKEIEYEWPSHAVLVVHSDGIVGRWDLRGVPELLGCEAIVIAAWLLREHLRGRDDATIAVLRLR